MVEARCSSFLVDDNGLPAICEAVVTLRTQSFRVRRN